MVDIEYDFTFIMIHMPVYYLGNVPITTQNRNVNLLEAVFWYKSLMETFREM